MQLPRALGGRVERAKPTATANGRQPWISLTRCKMAPKERMAEKLRGHRQERCPRSQSRLSRPLRDRAARSHPEHLGEARRQGDRWATHAAHGWHKLLKSRRRVA